MRDGDVKGTKIRQAINVMKEKKWNDSEFSPCCNCKIECEPKTCYLLNKWLK